MNLLLRKARIFQLHSNRSTECLQRTCVTTIRMSFFSTATETETFVCYSSEISEIIRSINGEVADDIKRRIHASAIKSAFDLEAPVSTSLVNFYLHLSDFESARTLFSLMPVKDSISWSAMISGLCKSGEFMEAINTFRLMQSCFGNPNLVAFLSVLPACANTISLQYGKQIHGGAVRRELYFEASLQNALIDMYVKCGKVDAASLVFDLMENKDMVSWKNLIIGCIKKGERRKGIGYFLRMRTSQVEPGQAIIRNLVAICPQISCFIFGVELHCYCIKSGLMASVSIGTAILKMYADFKEVEIAEVIFGDLQHKDRIALTAMISVYSYTKQPIRALNLFKKMVNENIQVNEITLITLLQACSLLGALKLGRSIHGQFTRLGYSCNVFVISSLIDYYCKLGILRKAEILLSRLQKKDLVCWSAMIHGYGINGCGEKAIHTFSTMLDHGMMPNKIVFISLLSACGRCGLLDEGLKWLDAMEKNFGVVPSLAHYGCIVELLGRKGMVEGALEFIRTMPLEPDASIWVALLSWCGTTDGDLKVAEVAAKELVRIDPKY